MQRTRGGSRPGTGRKPPWLTPPGRIPEFLAFRKLRTGAALRQRPRSIAILSVSLHALVGLEPTTKRAPTRAFLSVWPMISRSVVDCRELDRWKGQRTGSMNRGMSFRLFAYPRANAGHVSIVLPSPMRALTGHGSFRWRTSRSTSRIMPRIGAVLEKAGAPTPQAVRSTAKLR